MVIIDELLDAIREHMGSMPINNGLDMPFQVFFIKNKDLSYSILV